MIEYKITPDICALTRFIRFFIDLKNERELRTIIAAARRIA
jgi:hypothetical protein